MHPWKRHYVAIDTETSGLLPDGRLIEFAAVRCDRDGNVLGRFSTLVCPDDPDWARRPGAKEALATNKIDPCLVANGRYVTSKDLWHLIYGFLAMGTAQDTRAPIVVAHNVVFDVGILLNEFTHASARNGDAIFWPTSLDRPLCTIGCDLLLRPGAERHSLAATADRWGIVMGGEEHRALGDAMTCAQIFAKQLRALPELDDGDRYPDPLRHIVEVVDTLAEARQAARMVGRPSDHT